MSSIDTKYADLLGSRLGKFVRKKIGLWNFRCPYCGDSQKYKNKARGYFFLKKNDVIYKCHNCGVGRSMGSFLKDNATDLYDQYVMERYKSGLTGKGRNVADPDLNFQKPKFFIKRENSENVKILDLPTIDSLNNTHPAKQYLLERKIPDEKLKRLFYTDKFQSWVNSQKRTYDNLRYDHPRIIIPLINSSGDLVGFQGRSLDPKDKLRYITIMLDEDQPKIFGLDKVDETKTVYITEGPFDSLFLPNAVAMCGADGDLSKWGISNTVWIYDNEPRNAEIVARYASTISRGERIVIWPSSINQKDINDMVLSGHDVQSVIESNTFNGLEAQVKFTEWKKV